LWQQSDTSSEAIERGIFLILIMVTTSAKQKQALVVIEVLLKSRRLNTYKPAGIAKEY